MGMFKKSSCDSPHTAARAIAGGIVGICPPHLNRRSALAAIEPSS